MQPGPKIEADVPARAPGLADTLAAPVSDPARTATQPGAAVPGAPGAELPAGIRLGHFRVDRKLGAGGMGEVYLATDLALDRPVAIKVLPAGSTSGTARERLIREARSQARIQHPNVAHIYFIGEEQGRLYFAMEYISGKTLAEQLADAPLSVEDALATIRAAVLGLREAERSGFTHRDVKPSNLMRDANGVVKVVDFGLVAGGSQHAHPEDSTASTSAEAGERGPTPQTSLAGTPLYMAPEQARGEPVDLRADIYALGATLFHLVSGRPPFQADTLHELVTLHASAVRPPVPRGKHPKTAVAAIDSLVAKMMAPRPEDRFASYDELLVALDLASVAHTKPGGFIVRCAATAIDFLLLAIIVALLNALVREVSVWELESNLLNTGLLFGYLTLAIARFGTTFGKSLFELEVVDVSRSTHPSLRKASARATVMLAPLLCAETLDMISNPAQGTLAHAILGVASVGFMLLGIVNLLVAVETKPGKRAAWDRMSGTMVRYRTTRSGRTTPT